MSGEVVNGELVNGEAASASRRLLLVHAHPDDETIGNGATMAKYAAQGAHVTLVTCTRGEQGEVIPPELAHLAADRDDTLGAYRVGELAAAMAALGVRDHRFLDELPAPGDAADAEPAGSVGSLGTAQAPLYRDSGMTFDAATGAIVLPDDARPNAFARADVDAAAARLAALIVRDRPQVLVTYDPGGGYGHPDHVQAHRVAMRAVELAGQAPDGWQVPKVYWSGVPRSLMLQAVERMKDNPDNPFRAFTPDRMPSMVMDDDLVTTAIDGSAFLDRKRAALAAHATQIAVDGAFFALSNDVGQPLVGHEFYRLVHGIPAGERGPDGRELDLFAGVA